MCEITITGHVSTLDAMKYILKFNIIIERNAWRFLNGLVHKLPLGIHYRNDSYLCTHQLSADRERKGRTRLL